MEQAMEEIRKVTQLISDISHASAEQNSGVAQVAEAITHIDQTTQKNAALVEEMAGAAAGLRHQSDQLVRVVSVFRLQGGSNAQAQAAPRAPSLAPGAAKASVPQAAPPAVAKPATPAASAASAKPAAAKPIAMASTADDDWDNF